MKKPQKKSRRPSPSPSTRPQATGGSAPKPGEHRGKREAAKDGPRGGQGGKPGKAGGAAGKKPERSQGPRSDRSAAPDRGKRSDRSAAPDRGNRSTAPDRGKRNDRGAAPDRDNRSAAPDRGKRNDRSAAPDRDNRSAAPDRGKRNDRSAASDRGNRSAAPDRSKRNDRGAAPDRTKRDDRNAAPDRNQRGAPAGRGIAAAAGRQGFRPMAAVPQELASRPIVLPRPLVDAWRRTILDFARLPRNVNGITRTAEEMLAVVVKQEAPAIGDLWEIFTQERGALTRNLLSGKKETVAYLIGFHLANAARAHLALSRAAERSGLAAYLGGLPGLVWHDFGSGSGAVAHAVAAYVRNAGLAPHALDLHLYDAVGTLLDAARALFAHSAMGNDVQTHRVPLEKLDVGRFGPAPDGGAVGYSLGYVWNELEKNPPARNRIFNILAAHAARGDDGLLLVLDPATQAQSRGAMELRDRLVDSGWNPLYPCPAATPCPMLRLGRDWCYTEGDWQRPIEIQTLDRHLGMDRSRLTGTLLVFATASLAARLAAQRPVRDVVVGRPSRVGIQHGRGPKFDYLVCAGDDLKKAAPKAGKVCLPRGVELSE